MTITFGELKDKLDRLADAADAVNEAQRRISFGGNAATMAQKEQALMDAIAELHRLREEPVFNDDEL